MARTLPTPSTLSSVPGPADVDPYRRDGFLVVESFASLEACAALQAAGCRDRRGLGADGRAHGVHHRSARAHEQPRVPAVRVDGVVLLRGGCLRRGRRPRPGQVAEHQQDRPRDARSRPGVRVVQLHARAGRRRHGDRDGRSAGDPVDVHLQAAAHRRRGGLPPGRHVPVHRAAQRRRLLVRHRGRHARERLPVGPTGRASWAVAAALRAGRDNGRRRHAVRPPRRHPAAVSRPKVSCRSRRRRERSSFSTDCSRTGATSTARRRAATPTASTASRVRRRTRRRTGCNVRRRCRCARSRRVAAA